MESFGYDICAVYLACITFFGATTNFTLLGRVMTDRRVSSALLKFIENFRESHLVPILGIISWQKYQIISSFMCFQLLTPISSLIVNMSVVDLMIVLIGNPIALYNSVQRDWSFSGAGCACYGFFMTVLGKFFKWFNGNLHRALN